MDAVRVTIRMRGEDPATPEYVTFTWRLLGAPVPQINDTLCIRDIHLVVKGRRFHVAAGADKPAVTLHCGVAGRRLTDLTPGEIRDTLKDFPSVELLG